MEDNRNIFESKKNKLSNSVSNLQESSTKECSFMSHLELPCLSPLAALLNRCVG